MSNTDEGWARPDHASGDAAARPDADPWRVPGPWQPPNWQPPNEAWPGRTYSSLAGLATALQVLLPLVAVLDIGLVAALLHRHTLLTRLVQDADSVSRAAADSSDATVALIILAGVLLMIATAVVFIVWFYRARNNADVFGGRFQRRSRGWAIGGWFCPVVNLWFPYQIATDVLCEAEYAAAPPGQQVISGRPSYPLLRGWWLVLLVSGVLSRSSWRLSPNSVHDLLVQARVDIAATLLEIVAAVLAVAVVRRITTAHEQLRDRFAMSQPGSGTG
jgi:hypothetical protein